MSEPRISVSDARELAAAIKEAGTAAESLPRWAVQVEAGRDVHEQLSDAAESYLSARQRIQDISARITGSLPTAPRRWHQIVRDKS